MSYLVCYGRSAVHTSAVDRQNSDRNYMKQADTVGYSDVWIPLFSLNFSFVKPLIY